MICVKEQDFHCLSNTKLSLVEVTGSERKSPITVSKAGVRNSVIQNCLIHKCHNVGNIVTN